MLDDYKYSIGRLVVYKHHEPKLPRQSYGHHGADRTVGEIIDVQAGQSPLPHWVYSIKNARNQEETQISEEEIKFATMIGGGIKRNRREAVRQVEDGALAEMIAKALSSPERANMLDCTLKELLHKEELAARASHEGAKLPLYEGDYIRIRGDLRKESEPLHHQYAKIIAVEPSDIAGIENPISKPGQPMLYRTLVKYKVLSSEGIKAEIYDAEVKLFYTANARKTILNWRAATLLAEEFSDDAPYNVEYDYLLEHIFTREELHGQKRSELAQMLASLLYAKGKIGLRDYRRRNQYFAATPKSHIIDSILELSRFDARRNRVMTSEEISDRRQEYSKLSNLFR